MGRGASRWGHLARHESAHASVHMNVWNVDWIRTVGNVGAHRPTDDTAKLENSGSVSAVRHPGCVRTPDQGVGQRAPQPKSPQKTPDLL
jgi:hypothetical protein